MMVMTLAGKINLGRHSPSSSPTASNAPKGGQLHEILCGWLFHTVPFAMYPIILVSRANMNSHMVIQIVVNVVTPTAGQQVDMSQPLLDAPPVTEHYLPFRDTLEHNSYGA